MSLSITAVGAHVEAEAGRQELLLLGALPGLLATVERADDPAYERLHPVPYGDDEADEEFRRLTAPEIERARMRDRRVLAAVLDRLSEGRATLTRDEAECCMRAVGAARLAIAARHGFFEQSVFDDSHDSAEGVIVAFLGLVQDQLVGALSDLEGVAP